MITYPTASVFPPLPAGGTPLSELQKEVLALKKAKDAIILAHNYQCEDIQGVADFVGDSLQLAREATKVDADIIVQCGVHFMAETSKLLSPGHAPWEYYGFLRRQYARIRELESVLTRVVTEALGIARVQPLVVFIIMLPLLSSTHQVIENLDNDVMELDEAAF